jgi:AcrR family transcriptional regulator
MVSDMLEATARVLIAKGFANLSLQEVAEVAGVSPGSLYQYFPHREALVTALIERQADDEAAFLEARLGALSPSSLEEMVEASIGAVLAFRAHDPALFRALLEAIPHVGRYYDLRARGQRAAEKLQAMLALFHRPSPDGPTLDELTFVIANAVHSLTHEGLLARPTTMDDGKLAREATRLVLAYLGALRST